MKPIISILLLLSLTACNSETKNARVEDSSTVKSKTTSVKNDDATSFFETAAGSQLSMIEASQAIIAESKDQMIIAFAKKSVGLSETLKTQLLSLASQEGFQLPSALTKVQIDEIKKMSTLKEENKNNFYLKLIIKEQSNAIDIYSQGEQFDNDKIKSFSTNILPTLKQNYQEAKKLDSLYQLPKTNQGDDPLGQSDRKSAKSGKQKV